MTQNLNQFAPTTEQGLLDLARNYNLISCRIDPASVAVFTAGTAVKLTDVAGKILIVEKAVIGDDIYGFVVYSNKKLAPSAGDFIEAALFSSVMYMTASAAIARNANLQIVSASNKVATLATVGATFVGRAIDKAAADGDLIRVMIATGINQQVVVPTP